jgi:hypothetical protein
VIHEDASQGSTYDDEQWEYESKKNRFQKGGGQGIASRKFILFGYSQRVRRRQRSALVHKIDMFKLGERQAEAWLANFTSAKATRCNCKVAEQTN